jgi:hypothetical protein
LAPTLRSLVRWWLAECLDVEATRQAIKAMLDEQPVPLRGAT